MTTESIKNSSSPLRLLRIVSFSTAGHWCTFLCVRRNWSTNWNMHYAHRMFWKVRGYAEKLWRVNFEGGGYSSGFLRRPQQFDEISKLIWRLSSKFQINWEIFLHICSLLRKPKIYVPFLNLLVKLHVWKKDMTLSLSITITTPAKQYRVSTIRR